MENHGTLPFVLRGNRKESRLQLRRSAFYVEGGHAGVNGACTQILLNAEQLVVLGNALGAAGGTGLDLAGVQGNGQISNGGVLGLAGAVRADGGVSSVSPER